MSVYEVGKEDLAEFVKRFSRQQQGASVEVIQGEPDRLAEGPGRKGILRSLRLRRRNGEEELEIRLSTLGGESINVLCGPSGAIFEQPGAHAATEVQFVAADAPFSLLSSTLFFSPRIVRMSLSIVS